MTEKNNKDSKEQEEKSQKAPLDPTRYGDWERNGRAIDFASSRHCEGVFVEKSLWQPRISNQFFGPRVKVQSFPLRLRIQSFYVMDSRLRGGDNCLGHHFNLRSTRDDGGTINFIRAKL